MHFFSPNYEVCAAQPGGDARECRTVFYLTSHSNSVFIFLSGQYPGQQFLFPSE